MYLRKTVTTFAIAALALSLTTPAVAAESESAASSAGDERTTAGAFATDPFGTDISSTSSSARMAGVPLTAASSAPESGNGGAGVASADQGDGSQGAGASGSTGPQSSGVQGSSSSGAPVADSPVIAASPQKRTPGESSGVIDDDSYERPGLAAAQRVISAQVRQTKAGAVRTVIRMAAAPQASASVRIDLRLGRWVNDECKATFELRAIPHTQARAGFGTEASWKNTYGTTLTRSGATVTIQTVAASAIGKANWDCAWMVTGIEESPGQLVLGQAFYADDLVRPELSIAGIDNPIQAAEKGKWIKLRLEIQNNGTGVATGTKVRLKGKKLTIKPKVRTVGEISRRSSEYGVQFKVKLKGKKKQKLTITASANGGAKTTRTMTIARQPKPTKYKSLAGRYFWGFATSSLSDSSGWNTNAMWFANKKFVHVGFPKGGKLPRCTKKSKTCKRYSYNAKKGQVKIGKKRFKINSRGFTFKAPGESARAFYSPLHLPKKGTKFKVELVNRDWSGYCMLMCTARTERLSLNKKGRFVLSAFSVGSWPGLGSAWSIIPPDERGTYKVIGKGRIELKYANGKTKRRVIGVQFDDREKTSPKYEGIVLGDTNYYNED